MYTDDQFHPSNANDYDTSSNDSGSNTDAKHKKKLIEDIKRADSGYRKIAKRNGREKFTIEYYATNSTPGTRIRCPITGQRELNMFVGSRDEYLFYTCITSTGVNGNAVKGISRTPDILYYDSPEQYERHWNTIVSVDEKKQWYTKYLAEKESRKSADDNKPKYTRI